MDPVHGVDTAEPTSQLDDPSQPFKSLRAAIEAVSQKLVVDYSSLPPTSHQAQGIVYALPGLYGPHGSSSSGDLFPIEMRDRVHVKGVGANRCVIRGVGTTTQTIFWPEDQSSSSSRVSQEVLVDRSFTNPCSSTPMFAARPWCDGIDDTREVLSGFTFQGGGVQVFAGSAKYEQSVIISNCIFDMRDGFEPDASAPGITLAGPYFGIMMVKPLATFTVGYVDQKLLIAGNTFIMGQWGLSGGTEGWIHAARDEAVGVIDVTDAKCYLGGGDCNEELRGVGNPALINNLFRTKPGTQQRAFIGIDESDTLIQGDGPGVFVQTNVFATNRNGFGGGNGTFFSKAMNTTEVFPAITGSPPQPAAWDCGAGGTNKNTLCGVPDLSCPASNCIAATLPVPVVALYDGVATEYDPGFIGEYLSVSVPGLEDYVDWRLLPGSSSADSPMKDRGFLPQGGLPITMQNGSTFPAMTFPELNPFEFDGEGFGNPRRVDGSPDVGFDEIHLINLAGSYGNYSNSHNVASSLNPDAQQGTTDRFVFFRKSAGGVVLDAPNHLRVHGAHATPSTSPSSWYQPFGTLDTPVKDTSLPGGFRKKYISFRASPPTPWDETLSSTGSFISTYFPLGGTVSTSVKFGVSSLILDDECAGGPCSETYFNMQAVFLTNSSPSGSVLLRSNLQAEYR